MICDTYINCDNASLSTQDLLALLIKVDSNGCPALNTVRNSEPAPPSFLLQEDLFYILQEDGFRLIIEP